MLARTTGRTAAGDNTIEAAVVSGGLVVVGLNEGVIAIAEAEGFGGDGQLCSGAGAGTRATGGVGVVLFVARHGSGDVSLCADK